MSVSWVLLAALALVHNGKAGNEQLVDKDMSGSEKCTHEACGRSLHPMPVIVSERDQYQSGEVSYEVISEAAFLHSEVIKTNFTCDDKPYIPGFYGDMETKCQVFHLCMKTAVDHFLCPQGTGFDQKYLVCSPDGKKYCGLTNTGYIMNLRVPDTFPIITGPRGYDLNRDRANRHYKELKDYQSTNMEMLDRDLIRIMILLQFAEVSHIIPDMVTVEHPHSFEEEDLPTFPMFSNVLDDMLFEIFPLIPVNYSTDPQVPSPSEYSGKVHTTVSEHKRVARSLEFLLNYFKSDLEEDPEKRETSSKPAAGARAEKPSLLSSSIKDPSRRALKIIKTILDVIGNLLGKISLESRSNIVTNYINYLNKFSRSFRNATEM